MSENNYGALMLRSALDISVDVTKITSPGIYPIIQGNINVPDASAGLLTVSLTPSKPQITFQKENSSVVYSFVNGNWEKPTATDVDALAKSQNGADIPDKPGFIKNVGLIETVDQAAGAMQKSQNGGDIPDKDLFVRQIGAALALSGGVAIGGDSNPWTTAEFIAWLESCGAFNHPYWMCKGSWDYAGNKVITDTGCGNICLAGAVIEVMGTRGAMTIRITTPTTTSGGGVASAQFTYINHGEGYAPGWRREFSRTGDEMTGNLYLKNDGRVNFCIMNEDGTPRMWIFKDKGSDGIHINNGNDGGGDFIFGKDGNFRAGAAIYANNGDVFGTAWGGGNAAWLSSYLYLNMVKAIRLGPVALSGGLWRDFQLGGGQVVTGFHTDGDWEMEGGDDKVYYRPIQYLVGETWVTAPSV
ncbi:hypothetical protein RNF85_001253 [Salmonella enterica]|nr:hypothetical protein [Salmonella enterica]